ncbi:MAG: 50S ribosomal protein L30 [Candidatus Thermoplasmatota archaeon]|jgi:large subunit ribosomal protein L30|nr:50S ribosomal protein L30 [Candidatus Thermoplasmatota archaeon]MCL5790973.1 50S ribosomal protein L30 [Candidatus Thermoplasmatota archaeon]
MLAVIRIRGRTGMKPQADKTVGLLRLHRINHMVIIPESETTKGMLQIAKDYVTWGEIDKDTLVEVLKARALLSGRKKLTEEYIKENLSMGGFDELADALLSGKIKYGDIPNIVPLFRMHPPAGGLEYIRKSVGEGGTSGYRGSEINKLIRKMLVPGVKIDGTNKN